MAAHVSNPGSIEEADADKEWLKVDTVFDKAAGLSPESERSDNEVPPSPSSTVHGVAELKAEDSIVDDATPVMLNHNDREVLDPSDDATSVKDASEVHVHAVNATSKDDKGAADAVEYALHPVGHAEANVVAQERMQEEDSSTSRPTNATTDAHVDADTAQDVPTQADDTRGESVAHAAQGPKEDDKEIEQPQEASTSNVEPQYQGLSLDNSATSTPMTASSDDLPMSAYEHAKRKQASSRQNTRDTYIGSGDTQSAGDDSVERERQSTAGRSQDGAAASIASSSHLDVVPSSNRTVAQSQGEDSSIFDEATEDLAATLSQIDYGPDAKKEGESHDSGSVVSSGSEPAPPPPPKSPRHQQRYALPIGGPSGSGPRPELLALLRAPQSTTSLRSQMSTTSSIESASTARSGPSSSHGHSSRGGRKKTGPSSPRRRSSLPKLLTATSVSRGKGRSRSKSVSSTSDESEVETAITHRKGSTGSALAPLVEEDKERGSDSGKSRPDSPLTDASMKTAKEDMEDGAMRDSEDEFKEARSHFGARLAAPAIAALGSAMQARKAPMRQARRKFVRAAGSSSTPMSEEDDDDDRMEQIPSSPSKPPRSPRNRKLELTTPKKASASTLMVDGQVFTLDDETDEYTDADVDATPKASRIRRARASFSGMRLKDRMQTTPKQTQMPNTEKTSAAVQMPVVGDEREQIKRPVRAEHEPMIYDEDEIEDVPPPGSYATYPPTKRRLAEAAQLVLYDEAGTMVKFGSLFADRRTLIIFLRHWLCPFCQMFAQSIQAVDPLPLEKAELDMVVVGQGHWHVTKAYKEVMQIPQFVRMYADPSRKIYNALGMTLRTNDQGPACSRPDYQTMGVFKASMKAVKKGIVDMPLRVPGDLKLLGGEFILGPGMQCSFTHRMVTTRGHLDLPRVLAQAGCDLSLMSPQAQAREKLAKPASVRSENRHAVRRAARRIARRARPSTPREALAMKSSRAAALAAQQRTLSTQRTSGSLARQYASPMVRGENGDYIVDVGPPRLSGDGISLAHTTPKRSPHVRRQASGTIRPPLPLSSSASAYAAASERQRNYASPNSEDLSQPVVETLASSSTPALLADVPSRSRAVSDADVRSAPMTNAIFPQQTSVSYDVAPSEEISHPGLLQPSAFATPRKPLEPRTSQQTRPRAPSVGRVAPDEVRLQMRTSSMRGGTPIGAPASRAGSTDMDRFRSRSSSSHSSNHLPPVPVRYASNAPGLPLSAFERRVQEHSYGSASSSSHASEPTGNPLLSSLMTGRSQTSSQGHTGSEARQATHIAPSDQYTSPLLAGIGNGANALFVSPPPSSSGHEGSMRSANHSIVSRKPVPENHETDYKRLSPTLLYRKSVSGDSGPQGLESNGLADAGTRQMTSQQELHSSGLPSTSAGGGGPLFAAVTGRTPKGRIISLHADELQDVDMHRSSLEANRFESGAVSHASPPVPPLPAQYSQDSRQKGLSSRAPQPAFVPAFASVLAAEEARKTASSTGHGSYESTATSDITSTSKPSQMPWHEAVFGSNAAPPLFAGLPAQSQRNLQSDGGSNQFAKASSISPSNQTTSYATTNTQRPRTASSTASGSFLDDLNSVDGYHSRFSQPSSSIDTPRSHEAQTAMAPIGASPLGLAHFDSSTSLGSDQGDSTFMSHAPLFAALGRGSQPASASHERSLSSESARSSMPTSPVSTGPFSSTPFAKVQTAKTSKPNTTSPSSTVPRRMPPTHSPTSSMAFAGVNSGLNRLSSFTEEEEDDASPRLLPNLALFAGQRAS